MIKCKKCEFTVLESMKHALVSNMCPSCGSKLFSDADMNQISFLQNKISAQKFGKKLDTYTVYDITIFMLSEMKKMKKRIVDEMQEKYNNTSVPVTQDEGDTSLIEEESISWDESDSTQVVEVPAPVVVKPKTLSEREKDAVRREVASIYDAVEDESSDEGIEMGGDDDDDKISRLRRIASKHSGQKNGAAVRRLDN